QRGINIDILLEAMQTIIPSPKRDPKLPPLMYIIRSFDINKPGTTIKEIEGGIIGGTIAQGKFVVGEEIEIRPGIMVEREGKTAYDPLVSEIVSLHAGEQEVKEATCGGLVGVGTLLDPSYSKADGLTGSIAGKVGMLPPTLIELTLETYVLERAVGTKELLKVEKINPDEILLLHIGAAVNIGKVVNIKQNTIKVKLTRPICALPGSRVAISRKITSRWRLIGYGLIKED
ncbi:MAG: translation initiation factor IF-2 subunit gamma, partial [Crenarchaeota archaeon]|nr:translation initiation factor IF-2 subunit gamma [Thermoproteota archaeon]